MNKLHQITDEEAKRIKRNRKRIAGERAVGRRVVRDLLAAGYTLTVGNGGEEPEIKNSTSFKAVSNAMMLTDEEHLIARKNGERSWVFFVYGNDSWEVICDYTTDLEDVLKGAFAVCDRLEARGR
jgi:hypothetical protein